MAGYKGYSMSNNAVSAYEDGERPLSKWTKKEIINAILEIRDDLDFSKLTLSELRTYFLYESSWHHTSKFYSITYFYSIDEDYVLKFTKDKLDKIIKDRPKKTRRDKSIIELDKQIKEIKSTIRKYKSIAKRVSQNEYYIDGVRVDTISYEDLHIVKDRIKLLEDLIEKFKHDKDKKYKTVRGYIKNYLKSNTGI